MADCGRENCCQILNFEPFYGPACSCQHTLTVFDQTKLIPTTIVSHQPGPSIIVPPVEVTAAMTLPAQGIPTDLTRTEAPGQDIAKSSADGESALPSLKSPVLHTSQGTRSIRYCSIDESPSVNHRTFSFCKIGASKCGFGDRNVLTCIAGLWEISKRCEKCFFHKPAALAYCEGDCK